MNAELEAKVAEQLQIMALLLGLGISPKKAVHGFNTQLKKFTRHDSLSLEEMAGMRAKLGRWSEEHTDGWAKGYAEGLPAAVVQVLEERDIEFSDEMHHYITVCTDVKDLTEWLTLASTVTDAHDLFAAQRGHM